MKIHCLKLENFKGIKESQLNFNGNSVIIFGINGVGKSTILNAINILFAQMINKISQNKFKQMINLEIDDIKFGESDAVINVNLSFENSEDKYSYFRKIEKKTGKRTHALEKLVLIEQKFMEKYSPDNATTNMPIYANYGVNRAVYVVPIKRIHSKHTFDKLSAFEKAIENKIDFRMFFEWFREQQELENYMKINEDNAYINRELKATKKAVLAMLNDEGFSDIKIMFNPVRMVATKNNENLKIEQLSDGEKCTLAMIGDLARRLAIANPSLENPLEGEGIVLIDEIELHLHPTWQSKIVPVIMRTFPKIQFIITTHSPKVLGEVDKGADIYAIVRKEQEIEISKMPSFLGRDSNYILETYMDTPSLHRETTQKISRMYTFIKNKEFEEAENLVNELVMLTDNMQSDVLSAQMLIARGKAKL